MAIRPGAPPQRANIGLYAHYKRIKDAARPRCNVTEDTVLAALDAQHATDRRITDLKSFTGIAACTVRCRVRLQDGTVFPPTVDRNHTGYGLYVTYNHLMYSPKLRLECRFSRRTDPYAAPFHTIALEFPLSLEDARRLSDFNAVDAGRITFMSHGATSSGLDGAKRYEDLLGQDGQDVKAFLTRLMTLTSEKLTLIALDTLRGRPAKIRKEIHDRLPGGSGPLLTSIEEVEYAAFSAAHGTEIDTDPEYLKTPMDLMNAGFPMTPLAPLETFSTVTKAEVHLTYATSTAYLEEELSLKLWAKVSHQTTLFRVAHCEQPILAVKFIRDFARLGGAGKQKSYKLPREIHVAVRSTPFPEDEARNSDDGITLHCRQCEFSGIPGYDAFFEVLNPPESRVIRYNRFQSYDSDNRAAPLRWLYFRPHFKSFTYTSYLETSSHLQHHGDRWHAILLNGDKSTLETVDITASVGDSNDTTITEADNWMFGWREWNPAQKAVLAVIHEAKGGVVVVKGIAGTGKSLLQSVLAIYFARLGFKVLVALPSNTNATHSAEAIVTATRQDRIEKLVRQESPARCNDGRRRTPISPFPTACRVFASSLGHAAEHTTRRQAEHAEPFHDTGASSTLRSFLYTLGAHATANSAKLDYAIEHRVIEEAEKGEFVFETHTQDRTLGRCANSARRPWIDLWGAMRDFLRMARDADFKLSELTPDQKFFYSQVYKKCKSQVLAATDILICTTGNVRCAEVLECWLQAEKDFGIEYKGVICLLDEAFKDLELGTWNAICAAEDEVKGVFLFGDDMQLKPVNTTSNDELVCGQFNQQIDVSLAGRLDSQGFPVIQLLEQSRMHGTLSEFPSRAFYNNRLRDHPRVNTTCALPAALETKLHGIIADSLPTENARTPYLAQATEEQARHHYIQVTGTRKTPPNTRSSSVFVEEHVEVFFDHIFPALQEYFGHETHKNVMVICAYSASLGCYKDKIEEPRKTQVLPASLQPAQSSSLISAPAPPANATQGQATPTPARVRHPESLYPRCLTVDASQGQESFCVIFDGSFQHDDKIGFVRESGRSNVALTRAQATLWIIGGQLDLSEGANPNRTLAASYMKELRGEMYERGRWHEMKPKRVLMEEQQQEAAAAAFRA